MKLSKEEQEILRSVENGEWESVPNLKEEIVRYRQMARETLRSRERESSRTNDR